jgi:ankyrin repeat protein/L-ascorbate metabolism protein UlaG (beta-lactamase superfamily)
MRVFMAVLWVMLSVATARAGEIHDAVAAGDAERVAALLRAHSELVRAPNENQTRDLPLHTAAIGGQLEMARRLLDAGADIDGFDADESTPLHVAALNRHPELVDLLISRGANVNRRDRNGAYALSFAVTGGDSLVVQRVLDAGADLNCLYPNGTRLMHVALSRGLWNLVDRLRARGDDINAANLEGQTPMHWLGYSRDPQRVQRAIARGARVAVADTSGRTPLHNAADRGNFDVARIMVENGAVVDAADHFGWTPLTAALVGGNVDLVRFLLERGAEPNRTVWEGMPILFLCLRTGQPELVRAMLEGGARVDGRQPDFNRTFLHRAVEFGYADITALALERGCPIDARDNLGYSALDIATRCGHTGVADLLTQRSAPGAASAVACNGVVGDPPKSDEASVWYLGHSGWAIETPHHFLIFDYFTDPRAPDTPSLCNGCIVPAALAGKQVTVFASHEHQDHYHAPIFEWRAQIPRITYVMGFRPPDATGYEYVAPHETRDIGGVKVTAIPANDSGEGFWVEVDGLTLFHAGDHACRTRDLSGNYTPEIQFLAARGVRPDIAFLPISGCNFGDQVAVKVGTEYTLETLKPKLFLPMHAGRQTTTRYRDFIDACGDRFPQTRMPTLYCAGDHFTYRNGKAIS